MLVLSFLCEDRRGILLWAKFRLQRAPAPEQQDGQKKKNGNQKQAINLNNRTILISDRFLTFSPPYFFLLPSNIDTRAHI